MRDNVKAYMKMMLKSLRSKEQRTENEKYMYHKGFQIGYDYQKKRIVEAERLLRDAKRWVYAGIDEALEEEIKAFLSE